MICINNCKSKIKKIFIHEKICYFSCTKCKYIFHKDKINKNNYNLSYFNKFYKKNLKVTKKRNLEYQNDKKIILQFYDDKPKSQILDFGAGNGEFIKKFKSRKFIYEINTRVFHNKIKYLNYDHIKKYQFDLIKIRGTIEHLSSLNSIKQILKSLKVNGLLFISATPNYYNLNNLLSPKKFNQLNKLHISQFDYVNLSLFLLKLKMFSIHLDFPYYFTPYQNLKKDYKNIKNIQKSNIKICRPHVGNMLRAVYKKMEK